MRLIVFMTILVTFGDAGNPFKKIFGKIGRGFDSMICRVKHRKAVLDSNNRFQRCERKCPSNYKEKYSVHWGHHCKPADIPNGCIDESCIRCLPGYNWMFVLNEGSKCVAECPKGFWKTTINTCMQCTLKECEECTDQRTCTKCKADTALYKTFMKSVICVNSCPLGNKEVINQDWLKVCIRVKNDVTTSQVPATVTESSTKNDSQIGCVDDNCVSCKIGYFKYYRPEGGSECLEKCPIGHSTVGTLCVACSDKRCASCNLSLAECDKCFPGYSMLLDSFNITTKCVRDCPKKHEKKVIDDTSVCIRQKQQECPVANCKKCLRSNLHVFHGGCEECSERFILFRGSFRDYCYTSCPEGYYETRKDGKETRICNKCLAPFCSKCESENSTCLKCMEPMILDKVLQRCTTCPVLTDYDFRTKRCVPLGQLKTTPMGNVIY